MSNEVDDQEDRWEPTVAELRDGERADLDTHARRNLQQIRQGERERRRRVHERGGVGDQGAGCPHSDDGLPCVDCFGGGATKR